MVEYTKLRSSSPSNGRQEDAKPVEPRGGKEDVDLEQHERLLSQEGDDESEATEASPKRRSPSKWWLLALVPSAVVVIALLGVLLRQLLRRDDSNTVTGQTGTFRRPDSDYVLDPDWDYEATPTVRVYNWVIQDIVANPDGVFRPMLAINGKFPGELIECNEGDTIVVNVENRAVNATSIHWHGIFQNGTNWMDGTAGVTNCPIAHGRKFRYEFTIKGQAGTYFYHGHHAAQALDGLVGPIVIHSLADKEHQPQYATDRVVMLQDWYHDLSDILLKDTLSPGSEASPVPNGALINGANVVDCSLHPLRRCDSSTAYMPTFDLAPNEQHRLRFLNVGGFAWFEVSVDHHLSLPITEVDGIDVEPTADSSILVGPGQRYSVVLNANQTGAESFWLRARMLNHCFAENVLPEHGMSEAKAIVRYSSEGSAKTEAAVLPTTENDSGKYAVECKDKPTGTFIPTPPVSAPEYAHQSWYLRVNLEIGDWRLERGFLNKSTFRANLKSPTLHRLVEGLASNNESFQVEGVNTAAFDARHELVISSETVEVVDVVLQNFDEGNHPFHLHGAEMFILAAGHGYFPGYESLGLQPEGKGLLDPANASVVANPTRRDVATVEGFGWSLIRFVADNPGVWNFHCHMLWHAEAGMAMQFASRLDVLRTWAVPEESARLCEASVEELEKGATPKDSIFYGFDGTEAA